MLTLRLLGGFEARIGEEPISYGRIGARLLALLALKGTQGAERGWLAGTLWPDADDSRGLFYLRRALTELRKALGSEAGCLRAEGEKLFLDATSDWAELERAIGSGDARQIVRLHRGALLAGWHDDWLLSERTRAEQACLEALETLAREAPRPAAALGPLRQALALDPLRESAALALMTALERTGDRAAALSVYRTLRRKLADAGLGMPSAELRTNYERLRSAPAPAPLPKAAKTLARPWAGLIGRSTALRQLEEALLTNRLVTLLGPGGVGKTSLATAVAPEWEQTVSAESALVELAPLTTADSLDSALLHALGATRLPRVPPRQQALGLLQSRRLLLVLDNAEHVLPETAALAEFLLARCPHLSVLVTSRTPLGLPGERRWRVPPLSDNDSLLLFTERVERELTETEQDCARRICARLDGLPLAVEMAAARCTAIPLPELERRLGASLDLLTHGSATAPGRHRTLRAALAWSAGLLEEQERRLLHQLSIFRGGWTLEAAETVCDTPERLFGLVDQSLVAYEPETGRYRLLETVRTFAAEGLRRSGELAELKRRHARCFAALATSAITDWSTGQGSRAEHAIRAEWANLCTAAQNAAEVLPITEAACFLGALVPFWQVQGGDDEGINLLTLLLKAPALPQKERAGLLIGRACLNTHAGRFQPGKADAEAALALLEREGEPLERAEAHTTLGRAYNFLNATAECLHHHKEALYLFQNLGESRRAARVLVDIGLAYNLIGESEAAITALSESLAFARTERNPRGLLLALEKKGVCHINAGQLAEAESCFTKCRSLAESEGEIGFLPATLGGLSEIAMRRGNAEESLALSIEARAAFNALGNRGGAAMETLGVGAAKAALGRTTEALVDLRQALLWFAGDTDRERHERFTLEALVELGTALNNDEGICLLHASHARYVETGALNGARTVEERLEGRMPTTPPLPLDDAITLALTLTAATALD